MKNSNLYYYFHPDTGEFKKIDELLNFMTQAISISNSLNKDTLKTIEDIENELDGGVKL